jgi:hypothetical protein
METMKSNIRRSLIKFFYAYWHNKDRILEDGYTLLVPTPSDLPVFIEITIDVISKQNQSWLKEIIVVPDWPSKKFEAYFEGRKDHIHSVPMRLVNIDLKDKLAWKLTKSVNTRHFTQLIKAVDSLKTKHAIIHDADLFLIPGNFLLEQYLHCRDNNLNVYGLDIRKSFARDDRKEFVATWEMTFSTKWFLSFRPSKHKGQLTKVNGIYQEYDTTLLPQYLTDVSKISWRNRENEYFHFNYTICGYRCFINKIDYKPSYSLTLFLIRTLIDAFGLMEWNYHQVPEHIEFIEMRHGLKELLADKNNGRRLVQDFFKKIDGILKNNIFSAEKAHFIERRANELIQAIKFDMDHPANDRLNL